MLNGLRILSLITMVPSWTPAEAESDTTIAGAIVSCRNLAWQRHNLTTKSTSVAGTTT
jgi:hypothetical protein